MLFPFSQWPQWEILRDLEVWDHPCDEFHRLLYKREKARKLGPQMRFTAAKTCKDHWRSADSRFGMVWSALSSLCISGLWVGLDSAWKFCCRLGLIANSKAYWEGMQPATPWELAPWRDIERFIVYSVSRHAFPLRCPQHAEHRGVMMCSPRTNNNKQ